MKFFASTLTCPFLNLSFEEYLFSVRKRALLFYRNYASLIIGRNQNPFKEIVKESKLQLVRRNSGGGTVYQVSREENATKIVYDQKI
jgi:lipoate-protein ligase A